MNQTPLKRDRWIEAQGRLIDTIIGDMRILSGDVVGPVDSTWQDVAGTLSCNLQVLAAHIDKIRKGTHAAADASHLTMLIDQVSESVQEA